jgi:hypothetical protein
MKGGKMKVGNFMNHDSSMTSIANAIPNTRKDTNPFHGQIIFNIRYRIVIKILLIGARTEEKTELLFLALGLGCSSR